MSDFIIAIAVLLGAPIPEPIIREFGVRHELVHANYQADPTPIVKSRIVSSIGLPRIIEATNWPPAVQSIMFIRYHLNWLEDRLFMEPWREDLRQWNREAMLLASFWDAMYDAQSNWRDPFDRRLALAKCRHLLGNEDFIRRVVPPIVPLWRFRDDTR